MSASESIPRGAIFVWIFIVLAVIFGGGRREGTVQRKWMDSSESHQDGQGDHHPVNMSTSSVAASPRQPRIFAR